MILPIIPKQLWESWLQLDLHSLKVVGSRLPDLHGISDMLGAYAPNMSQTFTLCENSAYGQTGIWRWPVILQDLQILCTNEFINLDGR